MWTHGFNWVDSWSDSVDSMPHCRFCCVNLINISLCVFLDASPNSGSSCCSFCLYCSYSVSAQLNSAPLLQKSVYSKTQYVLEPAHIPRVYYKSSTRFRSAFLGFRWASPFCDSALLTDMNAVMKHLLFVSLLYCIGHSLVVLLFFFFYIKSYMWVG